MKIAAIETRYAGCRFRSRLEARWAVFFDHMGISWEYEPQGFLIGSTPYLPDFLLPECDTWIEVKGNEAQVNRDLMRAAAEHLPQTSGHLYRRPVLMLLGPIPEPPIGGDWHWTGLDTGYSLLTEGTQTPHFGSYGFGLFHYLFTRKGGPMPSGSFLKDQTGPATWLTPVLRPYDTGMLDGSLTYLPASERRAPAAAHVAYRAARSARFEHGQSGA